MEDTESNTVKEMKMTVNLSGYYVTYNEDGADEELFCGEEKSAESDKFKGIYKGDIKNGKANGKGIWEYDGGYYTPKIVYCGDFKEGKFHGKGSFILGKRDDFEYKGEFKDGKYNGKGFLDIYGHATYEGDFLDGEFHGKGEYIYGIGEGTGNSLSRVYNYDSDDEPNKMEYKGEFKNGKKDGEGYMKYMIEFDLCEAGFCTTEGTWKENKMHGEHYECYPVDVNYETIPDKNGYTSWTDPVRHEVNYNYETNYYFKGENVTKTKYVELQKELKEQPVDKYYYLDKEITHEQYEEEMSKLKKKTVINYYYNDESVTEEKYKELQENWLGRMELKSN